MVGSAERVESAACAWSHASLVDRGLALVSWDNLSPATQSIPGGYVSLDQYYALTVAKRDSVESGGAYIRIQPHIWGVARKLTNFQSIPESEDDIELNDAVHIPGWAKSLFQLGRRWLLRLHAHTPVARWLDASAAAFVASHMQDLDCRTMWTVFAAPPRHVSDFMFNVEGIRSSKLRLSICVRVERERQRIVVQESLYQEQVRSCTESVMQIPLSHINPSYGDSSVRWLLEFALQHQDRVDQVLRTMQGAHNNHQSPPTLTPQRRTELYALEQQWYRTHALNRRPF